MSYDAQVIVVGAGPAGSSTAWHLAEAGVDVMLLDRATFPRDKACSEYLSPEASRILSKMGALGDIEKAGAARLTGMKVRTPNGSEIHGEFKGHHQFRGFRSEGLAIRRTLLDKILLDSAITSGAHIRQGLHVTDVNRGMVSVLQPDGTVRELKAQIVVGADGLRSVVAKRLGLANRSKLFNRIALVTHYRGVQGVQNCGEMHVERGGYLGIADIGNGEVNVALVVPISRGAEIATGKADFMDNWISSCPHLADRFKFAERTTKVLATGPFAVKAKRASAPRAALVGDAADFFDPFTGEGIYSALRGGEILAPYIIEALSGSDKPLDAYNLAREREFGDKWKVERLVGMAVSSPFLMNHAGRVLSKRKDMADILIGVVGDFIPAREVLRPAYISRLLFS